MEEEKIYHIAIEFIEDCMHGYEGQRITELSYGTDREDALDKLLKQYRITRKDIKVIQNSIYEE